MKKYLIILILSAGLYAQGFDGVGLGFAGNYGALSRGVYSLAYNPANVAVPRNNVLELNFVGLNLGVFNNSFSYSTYQDYFVTNGKENYWDQKKKTSFLDLIPNEGLKMSSVINANVLGLAFNNFAMAVHPVVFGEIQNTQIKNILGIVLNGDDITRDYFLDYPNLMKGSAFSAVGVSLGYAYPVPIHLIKKYIPNISFLSVGFGINYYLALGVAQVEDAQAHVKRTQYDAYETVETTAKNSIRVSYPEGATPAGKGRSYNFGISGLYKDQWFVSLSFMNIAGNINYSTNTKRLVSNNLHRITIYHSMDSTASTFNHSVDTTLNIDPFSTGVPSYLRLGVAYYFRKNLVFTSEWRQGLNKAFGNSTTPRLGVGVQYKPLWWLPLRSGISLGGNTGFLMGFGLGLDFHYLSLDLSYAMKNALWPTHSEGAFVGFNFMIRI